MNEATFFSAIAGGIVSGGSVLLVVLGVSLLFQHGRYIPLWLPDLGMLGAYAVHALWSSFFHPVIAISLAIAGCAILSWMIHRTLIVRFLLVRDYLSPLLVGLGLSQIFQGLAALYGHGMSQHYPPNVFAEEAFSIDLGVSIQWVDYAFFLLTAAAVGCLNAFLLLTDRGLKTRAVLSNQDLADSLALPVRSVEVFVTTFAALLVCLGAVMRGIRYDLQPTMMFYPGLGAIVACIAVGPGQRVAAISIFLSLEIVASTVGTIPAISPLQRAIPFALLVGVFVAQSLVRRYKVS